MLQGIIFDLDGVVVDSHPTHKRAWKAFFATVGKDLSDQELDFVLEGQKREDILRHFLGNLSDKQVSEYGAQKESLFKNAASEIKPIHGLPEFLAQVDAVHLSMALASSASRIRVEYTLRQLNLDGQFQPVITGEDVARGKPDPAIFMLAAEHMHMAPNRILVCEDAVNGIQAAKAAGMKCLAIATNGRGPLLENAGADRVISDFSEVNLDELRRLFV